jgi:hypothetical protein
MFILLFDKLYSHNSDKSPAASSSSSSSSSSSKRCVCACGCVYVLSFFSSFFFCRCSHFYLTNYILTAATNHRRPPPPPLPPPPPNGVCVHVGVCMFFLSFHTYIHTYIHTLYYVHDVDIFYAHLKIFVHTFKMYTPLRCTHFFSSFFLL